MNIFPLQGGGGGGDCPRMRISGVIILIFILVPLIAKYDLGLILRYESFSNLSSKTIKEQQGRNHSESFGDTLAEPWRPSKAPPCYRHGNDWSACAGDHLMYPKASNPNDLLKRPYICLYEPLCWKQLDWQQMMPPKLNCSVVAQDNMKFYDWSLHDGTMAALTTTLEQGMSNVTQNPIHVFHCNAKRSHNSSLVYNYTFQQCPTHPKLINTWATPATGTLAAQYFQWFKTSLHAQQADAHITTFPPPMFEFLMTFNHSLIVHALHRVNMYRCSARQTRQNFDNLIRLASSGPTGLYKDGPTHIIAPGYVHDVEYIRHYTGIQPLYLPYSLLNILPHATNYASYTGDMKGSFIWNAHYGIPKLLKESNHSVTTPKNYQFADLMKYQAAIVLPYSITNTKSLEQYEMSIPIFAPTPKFAIELGLFNDRTATYTPYCTPSFTDKMHPGPHETTPYEFSPNARKAFDDKGSDEIFWISFSEVLPLALY